MTSLFKAFGHITLAGLVLMIASGSQAACSGDGSRGGLLHLDRCDEFESTGIFSRKNQQRLDYVVTIGTLGVALWEGTEPPLGSTAWKSIDSMVMAAVTTESMKRVFQRPRPSQTDNPNLWRQGSGNKSFPSGETAMMAAFVTPIILEWKDESPAVLTLSALPLYMAKARTGSQAHWASDVLVGGAIGVATGVLAARRDSPLVLYPTHGGVFVGLNHRF